ncbi:MAG: ATP-grasp domain-containing protein [Chlamydiia bacterium]|nr:ATP-grasp domain-containing protein [Chlamydiia bacterium]
MTTKKILITGARSLFALDLARRFHEGGHEVYTAETSLHHVCRFSNAVTKNFRVPSPRFHSQEYIHKLVTICKENHIDTVIPTFEETFCLSKGIELFPESTTVFCPDYFTLDHLHNKWLFNQKIKEHGFPTPETVLIKTEEDLHHLPFNVPYILKPVYSRAAQKIIKVTSKKPPKLSMDPLNPYVAQVFLEGRIFCSYSIAQKGRLAGHAVYPLDISIEGNSCLNFTAVDHPQIEAWVKDFIQKENYSGQLAFDFIQTSDDMIYAIECNPRGTSGLHLFQREDQLPLAFLGSEKRCVKPTIGYKKQIAWGIILFGWKNQQFIKFLKRFFTIPDVILKKDDAKPFLHQFLLLFVYLYRCLKLRANLPSMFTFDTDWNGQAKADFDQCQG